MTPTRKRITGVLLGAVAGCVGVGCVAPAPNQPVALGDPVEQRAMECLKRGVRYEALPSVRAQAIEALEFRGGRDALPWLRNALMDESPGVRFSAGMALGSRRDAVSLPAFQKLLRSPTATDRIVGIYGLHRLGDTSHTSKLAQYLLESRDLSVRSNAALVLGRIGGAGATRVLALALSDTDPNLRANVLEAMAIHGSEYAIDALHASAYGGIGAEETFAINALGLLRKPEFRKLFRLRLENSLHVEAKLAAARALALLGDRRGFDLALASLTYRASEDIEADTIENRTRRVRQLAAQALGAIGDRRALPGLARMMNEANDPRLQVVAAKAVLDIVNRRVVRRAAG
jgi:HEAT repeat protein